VPRQQPYAAIARAPGPRTIVGDRGKDAYVRASDSRALAGSDVRVVQLVRGTQRGALLVDPHADGCRAVVERSHAPATRPNRNRWIRVECRVSCDSRTGARLHEITYERFGGTDPGA